MYDLNNTPRLTIANGFGKALSLDKHPTLTRTPLGFCCEWCQEMAGTYIYPDGQYFARHDNCDCLFVVSGYNSRNGILKNYAKTTRKQTTEKEVIANATTSTNNTQIRDITQETLKRATPHVGSVKYAENWPKWQKVGQEEQLFASWLLNTLGGDIVYIPRSKVQGQNAPDYKWNGTSAELKTLTTKSLNTLSSKMSKASKPATAGSYS